MNMTPPVTGIPPIALIADGSIDYRVASFRFLGFIVANYFAAGRYGLSFKVIVEFVLAAGGYSD